MSALVTIVYGPDAECIQPDGSPRRHADVVPPDADAVIVWHRADGWHVWAGGAFGDVPARRLIKALRKAVRP